MSMETSNAVIGKNIKALREEMGLSQQALAHYLGISHALISYYEAGTRPVPTAQLSKLASLFCLDEYDFYEEDARLRKVNMAFAFQADQIREEDLQSIAQFKKIVRNYLNMKKVAAHGRPDPGKSSQPVPVGLGGQ